MHHEEVNRGLIQINLDITEWLRDRDNKERITILVVALDTGRGNAIVDLFEEVETVMQLQFSTTD